MKEFRFNTQQYWDGFSVEVFVPVRIADRLIFWEKVAEQRLTPHHEETEKAALRRSLKKHLMAGGTVRNYQF